jgi:ABC-2 type transport system permease protein
MLKLLVKKQLFEIFRSYFYDAKKNKARTRGATIGYIVMFVLLMAGLLGTMFGVLSNTMCGPLAEMGMDWLYFVIMGMMAVFLGAFGSVFNTYSGLYLAKDNDLLLSMPIPVRVIMTSRLLSVYLMGLMYSAIVILPAIIVYWCTVPITAGRILGGVVLLIVISLFVLTLSCALGWVVAKISLKLKRKSFITVIVSLVFFGLYYFVCFRSQAMITDLLLNAEDVGNRIKGIYPLYLFGRVGCGDGVAMLIVSAVVIALLALVWYLIARSFLHIATASGNTAKTVYHEKAVKPVSADAALLRKELGRFTSSPLYMLNCGLGTVFLVVLAVLALIKGREVFLMMNALFAGGEGFVTVLAALCLCLLAGSNDISTPSVSLEGKSLWIAQSLPIDPWQALRAKLRMHLLITELPLVVCAVCVAAVSGAALPEIVMMLVTPMVYVVLSAAFGLFMGLKRPNLNWTSEVAPIKQGLAVFLSMFVGWLVAVALGFLYYALMARVGAVAFLLAVTALFAVLALVLVRWLKTSGAKIYQHL